MAASAEQELAEASGAQSTTDRVRTRLRAALRPIARRFHLVTPPGAWSKQGDPPWVAPTLDELAAPVRCNICRWTGERFEGGSHVESSACPRCGSIARDRYLFWCFVRRHPNPRGLRVLETSPRLGQDYRRFMRRCFDYRASDYDLHAHKADLALDLQQIDLPSASLDVVLTSHVLEHVPDTDRALRELHRVVTPSGRVYVQVPLLQGKTSVPVEPEFHQDHTLVFFRFGWDLTDALRTAGFDVDVLVTDQFRSMLSGDSPARPADGEFDVASLVEHARVSDLVGVANDDEAAQLGFLPPHQFVTWECRPRS